MRAALLLYAALLLTPIPAAAQYGAIGLSAVGAQRFVHEDLLFYEPQENDNFARVLATGDFNNDGADDLATGIPFDDGLVGGEIADCGAVVVRYGVPGSGLAAGLASTFLNQLLSGSPDPAEVGDRFGSSLAACDFDHDGYDDLAVGIPNENIGSVSDAGAVQIFYGSFFGLETASQLISQATPGMPGDPETSDIFGHSLACGDFDGDTFADLAIGVPWEGFEESGQTRAGVVQVVYGAIGGLVASSGQSVFQGQLAIGGVGTPDTDDWFGWALAAGDYNSDGADDLAVGVPGEDGTGWVHFLRGDSGTIGFPNSGSFFGELVAGGTPEAGDQFGYALATGDFNGDLFDDLAIGVPFEDVATAVDGGQVVVLNGGAGFNFQTWSENVINGNGLTESGDFFGLALATGDFDHDGRDDLAIGHPGEFNNVAQDGATTVIMGTSAGLTNARRYGIASGYHGVPGPFNQANRNFGAALASGDFDGDGYLDLAIGAPNEDENSLSNVGAEVVLYGALFCDGLEVSNPGLWSTSVP